MSRLSRNVPSAVPFRRVGVHSTRRRFRLFLLWFTTQDCFLFGTPWDPTEVDQLHGRNGSHVRVGVSIVMPILRNARHEAFARALATGKSQDAAHAEAGYKPHRPSASRLRTNANVRARLNELLGKAADKAVVTVETIARQLDQDRQLAFSQGQAGAAVSASLAKARATWAAGR